MYLADAGSANDTASITPNQSSGTATQIPTTIHVTLRMAANAQAQPPHAGSVLKPCLITFINPAVLQPNRSAAVRSSAWLGPIVPSGNNCMAISFVQLR